jgi:hypothetical protein
LLLVGGREPSREPSREPTVPPRPLPHEECRFGWDESYRDSWWASFARQNILSIRPDKSFPTMGERSEPPYIETLLKLFHTYYRIINNNEIDGSLLLIALL